MEQPKICPDKREAAYSENGLTVELHRTGGKHYITLTDVDTGAFKVSEGYLSFVAAKMVYTAIIKRLGASYGFDDLASMV